MLKNIKPFIILPYQWSFALLWALFDVIDLWSSPSSPSIAERKRQENCLFILMIDQSYNELNILESEPPYSRCKWWYRFVFLLNLLNDLLQASLGDFSFTSNKVNFCEYFLQFQLTVQPILLLDSLNVVFLACFTDNSLTLMLRFL